MPIAPSTGRLRQPRELPKCMHLGVQTDAENQARP